MVSAPTMQSDGDVGTSNRAKYADFIADATQAVRLNFVSSAADVKNAENYEPEFTHQFFGDQETIFGYSNLKVRLLYSDASLHAHLKVDFDQKVSKREAGMKEDDIRAKIREQFPLDQQDMLIETESQFFAAAANKAYQQPFGDLVHKLGLEATPRTYELYRLEGEQAANTPRFSKFLGRLQSISLFYIDAADYTDSDDTRWLYYILYERYKDEAEGKGERKIRVAGFACLYRFYAHPHMSRVRVAQFMLMPAHRRSGLGARLLEAIYTDLRADERIRDVTAEDPADAFIMLRDYVDALDCQRLLPELFGPGAKSLTEGFTKKMRDTAQRTLKITPRQSRRVYEILRLKATPTGDDAAQSAYKADVRRRLEAPMRRSQRDFKKMQAALSRDEYATVMAALSADEKEQELEKLFKAQIADYRKVLDRIALYPTVD